MANSETKNNCHPQIVESIEVDGVDIGRVKDIDLAHTVAASEDNWRKGRLGRAEPETRDAILERLRDKLIKEKLASSAIMSAIQYYAYNIAIEGIKHTLQDYQDKTIRRRDPSGMAWTKYTSGESALPDDSYHRLKLYSLAAQIGEKYDDIQRRAQTTDRQSK